jgi:putative ABC transport system permease protein
MIDLLNDVQRAWRVAARSPGFTLVAIITLGLGIGANSTLFSIVNALLLNPLPFPDPGRIVSVSLTAPTAFLSGPSAPHWGYFLWRARSRSLVQLAAYNSWSANVTGRAGPEHLQGAAVAGDFFSLLGARPVLGRTFLVEGDVNVGAEGPLPVVLSHAAWVRLFNSDSGAIGTAFQFGRSTVTLAGVLPASFDFPHGAQFWVPLWINASSSGGGHVSYFLQVIGRLGAGVSASAASSELDALWRGEPSLWDPTMWHSARMQVVSLHERLYGASRPLLSMLFGAVALVLLIACANLASMLLARAAVREREFAIRAALGAGRSRVVRQVLIESTMLSLLGGALGLLVAQWGIGFFATLTPSTVAAAPPIRLDAPVLAFTAVVAIATGLLFGLAPALSASRMGVVESLKSAGLSLTGGGRRPALRRALVVGQLTAALVLVTAATLLTRSLLRLLSTDPGFQSRGLVAVFVSLSPHYPNVADQNAFYSELLDRVGRLPGVRSAALADRPPLAGFMRSYSFKMSGVQLAEGNVMVALNSVTPEYFRTVGATLVAGRALAASDQSGGQKVAVVNVTFARRFLGERDPIGRVIELPNPSLGQPTIVGEVNDIRQVGLGESAEPEVFLPAAQGEQMPTWLLVRAAGDPRELTAPIRQAVRSIDPAVPISDMYPLRDEVAKRSAPQRANAILFGLFGAVALLIAGMGLYGLMAFLVAQRTREIGVRVALGAARRDVLRLVMGQGASLIAGGIVLGLVLALALARLLRSMLFGVGPNDLVTFIVAPLLLTAIAFAATYLPARRALRVDPVIALRAE